MSMYSLVRLGIVFLFLILCYITFILSKKKKPVIFKISIIVAVVCTILAYAFPFENLFFRFRSPQNAFSYSNSSKILNTIEYQNNAAVLYIKNGAAGITVFGKDNKGWMTTNPEGNSGNPFITDGQNLISYIHINRDTLYIELSIPVSYNESIQVSDSNDTKFNLYSNRDIVSSGGMNLYYAFTQYEKGYFVSINGKKIPIN